MNTRQTDTPPTQTLPPTSGDARMHVLDDTCWCQPHEIHEAPGGPVIRLIHVTVTGHPAGLAPAAAVMHPLRR